MLLRRRLPQLCAQARRCRVVQWRSLSSGSGDTKPYYITTPIFYPNAVPHIGHLYSLVVADVFARFQRLREPSRPVHFLAGTDEHGLKIQKAAQLKNLPPGVFCDQLSDQFRKLADKAQISHTTFMRTTERRHHAAVEDVWTKLDAKGLIYKAEYSGWYSITDECFYTNAQVTTKPGSKPQVTISKETGSVVEWQNESNYMFRLSAFRSALLTHYKTTNPSAIFPPQHHDHILHILSGTVEDLSISRPSSRLDWGVRVPGDESQTVYVWFDALLVYLAGLGYPWKGTGKAEGWPADLQVIGKDILRFHAIYLPAILVALGLPLPQRLLTHAHWTVEQKKMSKSLGNVADPFEAMDEFGVDVVRFYLTRVGGRFRDDVDWSREQLNKHNKEIQSLLGNFFLRITSATIQTRIADAPRVFLDEIYQDTESPNHALIDAQRTLAMRVEERISEMEVSDAVGLIIDLLRLANKTITDIAPWKPTTSPSTAYASYLTSLETLRVAGICLQPFAPGLAGRLLDALGVSAEKRSWEHARAGAHLGVIKSGVRLF